MNSDAAEAIRELAEPRYRAVVFNHATRVAGGLTG
jgi:hypothetical protein